MVVVEFGGAFLENKAEGQRVESKRAVEVTEAHEVLDKFGGQWRVVQVGKVEILFLFLLYIHLQLFFFFSFAQRNRGFGVTLHAGGRLLSR